jgi:hypothetical protein
LDTIQKTGKLHEEPAAFLSRQSPAGDPAIVRLRARQRLEKSGKIKTGIVPGILPAFKKRTPRSLRAGVV